MMMMVMVTMMVMVIIMVMVTMVMLVMMVTLMVMVTMKMLVTMVLQTFLLSHRCHECCLSAPTRRGSEQGNCLLPLHCHRNDDDEDIADHDEYDNER